MSDPLYEIDDPTTNLKKLIEALENVVEGMRAQGEMTSALARHVEKTNDGVVQILTVISKRLDELEKIINEKA